MLNTRHQYLAIAAALTATICPIVWAQSNSGSSTQVSPRLLGKTVVLPPGTTFEGILDKKIGSSISHTQEQFTITISNPILINGADVLIPPGSQVLGEIVEAISSGRLEHKKGFPKPTGKMQVQLTGLKTLDGAVYPLVASLTGSNTAAGRTGQNNVLGGVGYMGSQSSFDSSSSRNSGRNNSRNSLVIETSTYNQNNPNNRFGGSTTVRSLVRRNHEIYIDKGAPLTIRLDAPLKISFGSASTPAPAPKSIKQNPKPPASDQSDSLF